MSCLHIINIASSTKIISPLKTLLMKDRLNSLYIETAKLIGCSPLIRQPAAANIYGKLYSQGRIQDFGKRGGGVSGNWNVLKRGAHAYIRCIPLYEVWGSPKWGGGGS